MLLINLIGLEGFLGNGNADGEGGSNTFFTFATDGAFMQVYKVSCQGQTESSADGLVLTVFVVVEALEDFFYLFLGNATACIAYLYI